MVKLGLRLTLEPGESPASFASRLAARHGLTASVFCADMGVPLGAIADGDDEALRSLSAIGGAPLDKLLRNAVVRVGRRSFRVGGEHLSRESIRRHSSAICPACLREDLRRSDGAIWAPFGRTAWLLKAVRTCSVHDLALTHVWRAAGTTIHDFSLQVRPTLERLDEVLETSEARRFSDYEAYVTSRALESSTTASWLDALTLGAATRACETVGAVALFGRKARIRRFNPAEKAGAGAAGYDILKDGEAGLRAFLRDLQTRGDLELKHASGPQHVFGRIYEWLHRTVGDPDFDPVREVVAKHIEETMALGPGDAIFGKIVEKRTLHSVRSASIEIGVHPKRLRKILAVWGFVQPREAGEMDVHETFSAAEAAPQLQRLKQALSLKEVESYLGAPRVQTALLTVKGVVRPLVSGPGIEPCYSREDLDEFVGRLTMDAVAVDKSPDGAATIPSASKRCNCSFLEIVQLILERRLARLFRSSEAHGFMSVLVDVEEVRGNVRPDLGNVLTLGQIERDVGVPQATLRHLLDRRVIPSVVVQEYVDRSPRRIVYQADYEAFNSEFISLRNAARAAGIASRQMRLRLDAIGVQPVADLSVSGGRIYERSRIPI